MIRNTATIGFIVSHACPLKCNFCWHDRSTIGTGRLDVDTMVAAMIAFGAEKSVAQFAFSGGEPMLYFADIVRTVEAARAAGVTQNFHIATAGHWAAPDTTEPWLRRLQDLGMNKLKLSYDREHARFVTPEQIMDICRTATALGIRVDLDGTFWDAGDDVRDLLPELDSSIRVHNFTVELGGRAKGAETVPGHAKPDHEKLSCGRAGHYLVAIYPNGDAYPCCSGDFNKAAGLGCGNIRRDSARTILENAYADMHVRTAKELGWGVLYEVVARDFPELRERLPSIAEASGACEICRDLNVGLKQELAPVYQRIETAYASGMAQAEWDRLDESTPAAARAFQGKRYGRAELEALFAADATARRACLTGAALTDA
jgi:MoaA/NifB/PqqE/SkfB family radical SAM enzyme